MHGIRIIHFTVPTLPQVGPIAFRVKFTLQRLFPYYTEITPAFRQFLEVGSHVLKYR